MVSHVHSCMYYSCAKSVNKCRPFLALVRSYRKCSQSPSMLQNSRDNKSRSRSHGRQRRFHQSTSRKNSSSPSSSSEVLGSSSRSNCSRYNLTTLLKWISNFVNWTWLRFKFLEFGECFDFNTCLENHGSYIKRYCFRYWQKF